MSKRMLVAEKSKTSLTVQRSKVVARVGWSLGLQVSRAIDRLHKFLHIRSDWPEAY